MARFADRQKAIRLRKEGKSYSEIRKALGVSKSSLSVWLREYPLSKEDLKRLRDFSYKRIESYRATMLKKKEQRIQIQYEKVINDLGKLSKRDLIVSGFFLYWGEGAKSDRGEASVSNGDPDLLRAYITWLKCFGFDPKQIRVTLHLYRDLDINKEINFWSKALGVPKVNFTKPYIKESAMTGFTHKTGFGHGTACAGL